MRKGSVTVAFLLMFGGVYLQIQGNRSKVLADDSLSPSYLTGNSAGKSVEGTVSRVSEPPGSHSLVSHVTGPQPSGAVQPRPHRVRLSWSPSEEISPTNGGIVGYNVYRRGALTSRYSRLNPDPVATPEYVDDHVQSGHIYYYATTAVNQAGRQSRPSNVVRVVIPFP